MKNVMLSIGMQGQVDDDAVETLRQAADALTAAGTAAGLTPSAVFSPAPEVPTQAQTTSTSGVFSSGGTEAP